MPNTLMVYIPFPAITLNRPSASRNLYRRSIYLQTQLVHYVIGNIEVGIDILNVVVILQQLHDL